jgi:hypothetical protein
MTTYNPASSSRVLVGDRVYTTRHLIGIPPGRIGTIRTVFILGDLYDVLFDGCTFLRIVHHAELVPAVTRPDDLG